MLPIALPTIKHCRCAAEYIYYARLYFALKLVHFHEGEVALAECDFGGFVFPEAFAFYLHLTVCFLEGVEEWLEEGGKGLEILCNKYM